MPGTVENRMRRTPEARRERQGIILDAVVSLLEEGGMRAVTTDAIAAAADISKATLYRYWPTKSDFLVAALGRVIRPIHIPDMGSLEEEIRAFLEARMGQYSQPNVNRLFSAILGGCVEDDALGDTFHAWVAEQMTANEQIIERGVARGEVDPAISVSSVVTMIAAPLVYRTVWERQAPSRELLETVVSVIVKALRP